MNIHRISTLPRVAGTALEYVLVLALALGSGAGCEFTSEELAESGHDASEDVGEVTPVGDAADSDVGDANPEIVEADSEDAAERDTTVELPEACAGAATMGLYAVPSQLDFGVVAVGETKTLQVLLANCGSADIDLEEWNWLPDTGQFTASVADESSAVLVGGTVFVGATANLEIRFAPSAPLGSVQTLLELVHSGPNSPVEIEVNGVSATSTCANAVIDVLPGLEVETQTVLQLSGDSSSSRGGDIVSYEWTVTQPAGNQQALIPSSNVSNVTFAGNVPGEYVFELNVQDDTGAWSCGPAVATVQMVPSQDVYIELRWDTPGDRDKTDRGEDAGSDLDLHFTHPLAGTEWPWFDVPFDCHWFNPNPDWESLDPEADDNPLLIKDVVDGTDPEIIVLDTLPDEPRDYAIGVHNRVAGGYGPSLVSVRVWVKQALVYESEELMLSDKDLWYVGDVNWPAGTVTPAINSEGAPVIFPDALR